MNSLAESLLSAFCFSSLTPTSIRTSAAAVCSGAVVAAGPQLSVWRASLSVFRRKIKCLSDVSSATSVRGPLQQCCFLYTVNTKMSQNTKRFPLWLWSLFPEPSPPQRNNTKWSFLAAGSLQKAWNAGFKWKGNDGAPTVYTVGGPWVQRSKRKPWSLLPKESRFRELGRNAHTQRYFKSDKNSKWNTGLTKGSKEKGKRHTFDWQKYRWMYYLYLYLNIILEQIKVF